MVAGHCQHGTLRFWLSAGRGDFELSTKSCKAASLYACLLERSPIYDNEPVRIKVLTCFTHPILNTELQIQGVEYASGCTSSLQLVCIDFIIGGCGQLSRLVSYCLRHSQVITSTVPIKPKRFATIKTTNYLANALALREAEEKGAQAGIWLDEEGNVAEGNNLNVGFVSNDGVVLLPPFASILPGCTARRLLQLVPELVKEGVIPGLKGVRLANIPVAEAKNAPEMMLLGSFVTILPVVEWDGKLVGNGEPCLCLLWLSQTM